MMAQPKKSKCTPATAAEKAWIEDFKKLAKRRPKALWLFSGSGTLYVMKTPKNGETMGGGQRGEGVNPENVLDSINIPNDGGDW